MGNMGLAAPRGKGDQQAAVDAEEFDDATQRVCDRAVDLCRR